MKKKIINILLCITIIISITGCFNSKTIKNNKGKQGKIYNIVKLKDKNITMFEGIIPEGWKAFISSQYIVNSLHPFIETVVIANPDSSAKITILSQHSYTENKKFKEGESKDYYTTYLHQMDANTYLDYYINKTYKTAKMIETKEVDSKITEQLKTLHNLKLELAKKDAELIQGQNAGVTITIGDSGYTTSKRIYENGLNKYEATTCISAIATNLNSSLSSALNSRAVVWYMPYVIIYEGETAEDFDKYHDDYEFIIANSNFTKDYYAMIEYVSSAITNAYTAYYAEKSKAGLEAMNNYIDSNYSSSSSASTNERVMQMWDDVIKEVDEYTTEDGSTIRTSMYNETVAQKDNEIYIGDKAGIPIGFNELHKDH